MNELTETITCARIGSMGYHAPELEFAVEAIKIDTKVDIWALGLTILQLITGINPLMNDNFNLLGERRLSKKIEKHLNKLVSTNRISGALAELLEMMLQIEPLHRCNLWKIQCHRWITEQQEPSRKKILFLDIDGVLNTKRCRSKTLKPELLMKLKHIINRTQCQIVLSSSWRRLAELKRKFKKEFKKIVRMDIASIYIGDTPNNGKNPTRVHEVMEYFEKNEEKLDDDEPWGSTVNWCVVDDMDLLNENPAFRNEVEKFVDGHWVQTDIQCGLSDENVEAIVDILNEGVPMPFSD